MPLIKNLFNPKSKGRVTYGKNVVIAVVTLAVKEISGVAGLARKGVVTTANDKRIDVDVHINLDVGSSVSDVAFRVQENIKRSVESMTEYKIGIVNVNVLDAVFDNSMDTQPVGEVS